jgi:anti-sigma-K factor RskA
MTKRDDAHLLSGAYALDAVTPEEAELVESAMEQSEELRSEVVGLTDTAVALGLGLQPVAPRPQLRASILDAIEHLPQEAPARPATADEFPATAAAAPAQVPDDVPAMPTGMHVPARRRRRRRPMALLAVAAAAVLLFGGGFLVQRTLLEPQSEYSAISTASDVQKSSASIQGGGTATVLWSRSEHRTAVVLNGVEAPRGKVLQLWSMRGGTITSAGLYEDGERYALISGTPSSGELLAVSVEPDGGSTQPTTKPIVAVQLDA